MGPHFVNRLRVAPGTTAMRVCRRLGRCWEASCVLSEGRAFSQPPANGAWGQMPHDRGGIPAKVGIVAGRTVRPCVVVNLRAAVSPPGRGKGRIPAVEELRSTRLPANWNTIFISQSRFCVTAFGCRSEKCSRGGSVREPHDHQSEHTLLPFCSTAPGHWFAARRTVGGSGETFGAPSPT